MIRLRIVQIPPATELRYQVDIWQPRLEVWKIYAIGPEWSWGGAVKNLVEQGACIVEDAREVGVVHG